jgi:ATP-dependent Lon protease
LQLLGPENSSHTAKERKDEVRGKDGIAWTMQEEKFYLSRLLNARKCRIYLTGKLGTVMKESGPARFLI